MGKKSNIIKKFDDDDAGELVVATEAVEASVPEDGEKKKRKRKRSKKEESDDLSAATDGNDNAESTGDSSKSESKVRKISGGTGTVVGESAVPAAASAFANEATVYIEGLPYEATEQHVRDFFKKCGGLKSIRLPTWQDSGRLRGYGHLEFDSNEAAGKAMELDGSYLMKRYIKVDRPKIPRALASRGEVSRPAGCKMVFVKNIPYDCTEEQIKDAFKVCGPIVDVRLARWGHTNALKGFCYVDFKREDSSEIAVKKSGQISMNGRALIIDFETGAAKGGFKRG
jgi:nucleolin